MIPLRSLQIIVREFLTLSLIAIGYKYNNQEVLSFITTVVAGSTKAVITGLSKYPYHFSNVAIPPVARTLIMFKLFGSVNEVYSHNESKRFGAGKVLGCSVWLDKFLYYGCYGDDYY